MSLFALKTYCFFILHGGFSRITPFIRRVQASFLLGLEVQDSLDVCARFLVSWSHSVDLLIG